MKEKKIKLVTIDEAKVFVSKAMQCNFDVDVCYDRIMVDAKSILGVLSLNLTRELTVRMHGENESFERYLNSIQTAGEKIA